MKQEEFLKACKEGNENLISLSLKEGLNPNFEYEKKTPLNEAIIGNQFQTVKLLIDAGAEVNFPVSNKETAILISAWFGNIEILKILISKGSKLLELDSCNNSVICRACEYTNAEFVQTLINAGISPLDKCCTNGWTPLLHAAYKGKIDIVEMLLCNHSENINTETIKGQTALMLACTEGKTEIVKLLLESGANQNIGVNKQHHLYEMGHFDSPLNIAAHKGYKEIVSMLLANGAVVDVPTKYGYAALQFSLIQRHFEVVKILIDAGADPYRKDDFGKTIYSLAKELGILDQLENLIGKSDEEETKSDRGFTDVSKMADTIILSLENMNLNDTYKNFDIDEGICYLVDNLDNKKLVVELEEEDGFDQDVYHDDQLEYKKIMLEVFDLLKSNETFKKMGLTHLELILTDHIM